MEDLFYVKESLGKGGKPIRVYKLQTMVSGAEEMWEAFSDNGINSYGKIINDPRIIPSRAFLRKYWIDELPQLWNLVNGDMKLVGIRPKHESAWERYPRSIMERALMQKPGLMGIKYAFEKTDNDRDNIINIETYLDEWEDSPIETDYKYFKKITRNIIFNGVRSS